MIKKPDTPKDDEVVIVAEEPDVHSAVTREVRTEDFSVMPEELIEPADPPVDPTADTGLVVDPSLVGTDDFDDPDETENLRGQQQVGAEDLPAAEADDPENTDQTENLRAQQQEEVEGQVIDNRYRITETLGSGGMGKVHRAVDLNLEGKKSVAIKILRANFSKDKTHRKRFEREIDALSTLKNDYIVDIHNRGTTEGGRLFFVMEDLKGISLSGALNDITLDSETFTWKRTKKIILQICNAIQATHNIGIVHRDLKPENIFLIKKSDGSEQVKILDFGIAKDMNAKDRLTQEHVVCGTPAYMSPEQASGKKVDHRTDIYSSGVIMYELLGGQLPFNEEDFPSTAQMLTAHIKEQPKAITEVNPDADVDDADKIVAIVMRCLEKDPGMRFQTMEELEEAIRAINVEIAEDGKITKRMPIVTVEKPTQILIVDDEGDITMCLKEVFKGKGYGVLQAANGQEALDIIRAVREIRLMVTDVMMPEMDGLQLVRILVEEGISIPTIFITVGDPDHELYPGRLVEDETLSQKDLHEMDKPFDNRVLVAKAEQLLAKK